MKNDDLPTPADVRRRLTEEWTTESEALFAKCKARLSNAQSTNISVPLERESKAAINRVIIALRERKWLAKEESGGDMRESWHNLTISPLPEPREQYR